MDLAFIGALNKNKEGEDAALGDSTERCILSTFKKKECLLSHVVNSPLINPSVIIVDGNVSVFLVKYRDECA